MLGVPKSLLYLSNQGERPVQNTTKLPYVRVNLPSEEHAVQLNKRSILIKDIIDEIGEAPTVDKLLESGLNHSKLSSLADKRFMFRVEGLGRTISKSESI